MFGNLIRYVVRTPVHATLQVTRSPDCKAFADERCSDCGIEGKAGGDASPTGAKPRLRQLASAPRSVCSCFDGGRIRKNDRPRGYGGRRGWNRDVFPLLRGYVSTLHPFRPPPLPIFHFFPHIPCPLPTPTPPSHPLPPP